MLIQICLSDEERHMLIEALDMLRTRAWSMAERRKVTALACKLGQREVQDGPEDGHRTSRESLPEGEGG